MDTRTESTDVIVVGAGPAGLAAARELMRAGRRVLVLEKGDGVGMSWRTHRKGLRLHTVRSLSGLPGMPIPRSYGRYPTSADLVRYLEGYTANSGIEVRHGVDVTSVERMDVAAPDVRWRIGTGSGARYVARTVVMATGYNRIPHIPAVPGLEQFSAPFLHVSDYRGGSQFAGREVLVVGAGNAASEAATALVAAGARRILGVKPAP